MHVQYAEYRGWRSETQRNIVADPDKHMNGSSLFFSGDIFERDHADHSLFTS
jgi:hypothetical protein